MTTVHALDEIISKYSASLSGQLLGAFVLFGFFYTLDAVELFYVYWVALLFTVLLLRFKLFKNIQQGLHTLESSVLSRHVRQFHLNVFFTGVLWGAAFFVVIQGAHEALQFFVMALAAVLVGSAILTLGSSFLAYCLFVLPLTLLLCAGYLYQGSVIHNWSAVATLSGSVYLCYAAYIYSKRYRSLIERNHHIENTQNDLVESLGKAAEYRDEETGHHVHRMSHACYLVGIELGFAQEQAEILRKASILHDIGKIGIPDSILRKPGKLTDDERKVIQGHSEIGLNILVDSDVELFQVARKVIGTHHEHWDGGGYPNGIKGEEIPLEGRIAAVCDVFDALISPRPYKKSWSYQEALDYIKGHSGTQFDPQVVKAFEAVFSRVVVYSNTYADAGMLGQDSINQ